MVSGMGCDFKDFDGDGWPDIFMTDLVRDYFTLFVNQGKGFFLDRTFPSGVGLAAAAHSGWSIKFLDIDNDGWKDVFAAGSHVVDNVELYSPAAKYEEPSFLYRNTGDGRIEDLSERVGPDLQVKGAWRGVAVADLDNDGTLEVAVNRLNGKAALFVKKGGAAHNWILLDLEGRKSNRDGIGARVRLVLPSGRTLHEHVTTANGIYSASDKRVHFGLGTETSDRLRRDRVAERDRAAGGEARDQPGPARRGGGEMTALSFRGAPSRRATRNPPGGRRVPRAPSRPTVLGVTALLLLCLAPASSPCAQRHPPAARRRS